MSYSDCSTTSGYLSLDPYVLRFSDLMADDAIYGNGERYDYAAEDAYNYATYPSFRFMNEFGLVFVFYLRRFTDCVLLCRFHSMPSFYSWEEVLESPDDFSFNSTVVASRQHHPVAGNLSWPNPNSYQGQVQMTQAVELWLPTPSTSDTNQVRFLL